MAKKPDKPTSDSQDIETFLEEQARLDAVIREKFTKVLTIMFTDLKGSTTIAETEGDMVSRMLIKEHNAIVLPAIRENNGVFVKSIGDGTLSYFEHAQDALRAAVRIQQGMDALNMAQRFRIPVLMRIGLHTGTCIVEKDDIFGDTVNTASRFESSANPGDILLSEETYDALSDKAEIYCRFINQVTLKGKKEPHNAYKAFWNPREIELDKTHDDQPKELPKPTSKLKLVLIVVVPLLAVLALSLWQPIKALISNKPVRELHHEVTIP